MGILGNIETVIEHNDNIIGCIDCFINKFKLYNVNVRTSWKDNVSIKTSFKESIADFKDIPIPKSEHIIYAGLGLDGMPVNDVWWSRLVNNWTCESDAVLQENMLKSVLNVIYITKIPQLRSLNKDSINDLMENDHSEKKYELLWAIRDKLYVSFQRYKATTTRIETDCWGKELYISISHDNPQYYITFTFRCEDRLIAFN